MMITALGLLALSVVASAAVPRAAPDDFTLSIQRMSGHDAEQDTCVLLLRDLSRRYPALFAPGVTAGVRFQIVKEKANQSFDQQHKALVVNPRELFVPWADASFYRSGSKSEPEATLFHELLHGWSYSHPGLEEDYQSRVSGGRQEAFIAEANEGHRPAKEYREKVRDALLRIRIGSLTREQYAAAPGPSGRTQNLADYDRAVTIPMVEAKKIVGEFQAEAEAGTGMMARLLGVDEKGRTSEDISREIALIRDKEPARFKAAQIEYTKWVKDNSTASKLIDQGRNREVALALKYKIPGRRADDRHAGDTPAEWFAYGGEIAAYAASPEALLTAEEIKFWHSQFELLRRK